MYEKLATKNTFLELPCNAGFAPDVWEDIERKKSSCRSSSSPPSLDRNAPGMPRASCFNLKDDVSTTSKSPCSSLIDDGSVDSTADEGYSTGSEGGLTEVSPGDRFQTPPPPMHFVQEVTQPAFFVCYYQSFCQSPSGTYGGFAEPRSAQAVVKRTSRSKQWNSDGARQPICFFQNRYLNSPPEQNFLPCEKGDDCKFCHEWHPLIKRRSDKGKSLCDCARPNHACALLRTGQ